MDDKEKKKKRKKVVLRHPPETPLEKRAREGALEDEMNEEGERLKKRFKRPDK